MPAHADGSVKGLSHVGPGAFHPTQLRLENKLKFFRFPILSSLVQALFISSLLPQVQTAVTRIRQFLRTQLGSRAVLNLSRLNIKSFLCKWSLTNAYGGK
jgi:hypothetical protein